MENKVPKQRKKKTGKEKDFLRDVVLLRNDPELVNEIRDFAIQGDVNAQYALGLVYAEGRGTEEDLVKSFAWLSLCIIQGDNDAEALRYIVGERMNDEQYTASLSLVEELQKKVGTSKKADTNQYYH